MYCLPTGGQRSGGHVFQPHAGGDHREPQGLLEELRLPQEEKEQG